MRYLFVLLSAVLAGCADTKTSPPPGALETADTRFSGLADEYLAGHLAFRPGTSVALGLHEYDGKITDYRRVALDAELQRLRDFDRRLDKTAG